MDGSEGGDLTAVQGRRAFEVERGGVSILNPDGRILRQRVPEGVNPNSFRHILAAVDLYWNDKGTFPTPNQAYLSWTAIPQATYDTVFATEEFAEALEKRGIPVGENRGLTEKQMYALQILTDPSNTQSVSSKLKDIGVAYSTYQNWMRQPLFSRLLRERSERLLQDIVPTALVNLGANVEKGDPRSIEFALKMTGRYDPAAIEVQNARTIVLTLVESIQKHASKDVVRAVMDDLEGIMTGINVQQAMKEIG